MNTLEQRFTQLKDWFISLKGPQRLLMGVLLALLTAGISISVYWSKQDPMQTLYSDLQSEDSKAVVKKLAELSIPYQLSSDRTTVEVPQSQVAAARMQLAKEGLPGQDVVGFEKFDGTTLGMSSYVQRIHYVRAVQGELTRSIQNLAAVKRARVHISVPPKKVFLEEEEPPKASVILELRAGQSLAKNEVNGIAHLVSSAVEGLKVQNVTIVDTQGNFLHRPEDNGGGGISSALLETQRTIENEYERRVLDILSPLVGMGKVRAKVTAEIDPSRMNMTEETFDPEKVVVKNTVKNDEVTSGTRPNPIGIPGSRSNLPGTEITNPPVPMASTTSEKNTQNTNFAIPRKVQVVDRPGGGIKRLTVAVVVDGNYSKPTGSEAETFVPRSEEELKRFQELVAGAVGFDSQRRDSITVSSMPFKKSEWNIAEERQPLVTKEEIVRLGLKHGLWALAVVLFFFMVVRPVLRWAAQKDVEEAIEQLPRTVAELEGARRDEGILALAKAVRGAEETDSLEKKEEEELRKKILEKIDQTPKKGFRIIQDWLEWDEKQHTPAAALG